MVKLVLLIFLVSVLSIWNLSYAEEYVGKVRGALRACKPITAKRELETCLLKEFTILSDVFENGDPPLNVKQLDPLPIGLLEFHEGSGTQVSIEAQFTNGRLAGISEFTFTTIDIDPEWRNVNVSYTFPSLVYSGSYDMKGMMLFLPISGKGTFWTKLEDVTITCLAGLSEVEDHLVLSMADFNITFAGNVVTRLNNLFDGDPILGETMNIFINENSKEIIEELKADIQVQISQKFENILNQFFGNIPMSEIPRVGI